MIKIDKAFLDIPKSLIPAFLDLFPDEEIPQFTKTTHERRMKLIQEGLYVNEDIYNSRYKTEDVKNALNTIYKYKCAFCEEKVEQNHVEHYRPKSIYYWLAFSWDNLLLACPTCNQSKGVHFEIIGQRVEFNSAEANIRTINNCSIEYDLVEQPMMVNPEVTDPLGEILFQKNGQIMSNNIRFAYTIEKCSINRKYLNDGRRKLLDVFIRDIRSALVDNSEPTDQQGEIKGIVKKFIRDSKDEELQFLAFRRFAISSGWIREVIKDMN